MITGQLTSSDQDSGATALFSISDGSEAPAGFELLTNGTYRFDPGHEEYARISAGNTQIIQVPVTVTDEHGTSDTTQIKITVTGTNDTPIVDAETFATEVEMGAVTGQLSAIDLDDGATLLFSISDGYGSPAGFQLNANGSYSFDTNDAAYADLEVGSSKVIGIPVVVTDDHGDSGATMVMITVTNTDDAPVVTGAVTVSGFEDSVITLTEDQLLAQATDVDSAHLTVENLTSDNGSLVDNGNGTWNFTPDSDFNGEISLNYEVSDGTTSVAAGATLDIVAVNDAAEMAAPASFIMDNKSSITLTQDQLLTNATDVDGDLLSVENLSVSDGTLVDNDDGTWSLTPDNNFNGEIQLNYDINDGTVLAPVTGVVNVEKVTGQGSLLGTEEGDVIFSGSGNDNIDGGAGEDTVVYAGNRDEYTISGNTDGSYTIEDTVNGRDGVDTLTNIEFLNFSDQTFENTGADWMQATSPSFDATAEMPSGDDWTAVTDNTADTNGAADSLDMDSSGDLPSPSEDPEDPNVF